VLPADVCPALQAYKSWLWASVWQLRVGSGVAESTKRMSSKVAFEGWTSPGVPIFGGGAFWGAGGGGGGGFGGHHHGGGGGSDDGGGGGVG